MMNYIGRTAIIMITLVSLNTAVLGQSWLPEYNRLLDTYRTKDGIRYQAWQANPEDLNTLDRIVHLLAQDTPPDTNDAAEISYYTNAYNILVLHGVLAETPLKSVDQIAFNFGFFSQKNYLLGGEKVSLNDIEKVRLLKQFGDARIHFIVNCASVSCPPLPAKALTADNLEEIMNATTTDFLNSNPEGIRSKWSSFTISKLFDWYEEDFIQAGGSVIGFINQYREAPLPEKAKIRYLDYDWTLNQSR